MDNRTSPDEGILSKPQLSDTDEIWQIILQAKKLMNDEGRRQWTEAYPLVETIEADINRGVARIIRQPDGSIGAYGAVVFTGEPAYDNLEGQWLSDTTYVVIHRLAVAESARGYGLAGRFLDAVCTWAKSIGVNSIKVDTNFDNLRILNMLQTAGFTYCGKIHYPQGERMAFEKLL